MIYEARMGKAASLLPSWYSKLGSTSTSRKAPDASSSNKSGAKGSHKSIDFLSSSGGHNKDMVASLIDSHLASRREAPWEQDFSSMSSCRSSKVDTSMQDDESLPPLLRNPHIAEFDIVEGCSSDSDGDDDAALLLAQYQMPESAAALPAKKRRNHNDNSFSACLPSEIKGLVADSIPLVKYSHNPYQDFRDSMVEMIQEKRLQSWNDLEELLFCYLSLNSPEHHELIKQSFSDVWQDLGGWLRNCCC